VNRTRRWLVFAGAAAVMAGAVVVAAGRVGADRPDHGRVDIGFLQDMIDHHEQANQLSAIALRGDASSPVANLALDVVAAQRYEIGVMEGWLIEWGLERGEPTRVAMAWMGMSVAPATMPGMAAPADVDALTRLSGAALDVRYLELLLDHHRGGLHMSDAAATSARNPHVRWLAGQMATNQRREIREIETLLAGRGG
jgi:uncharacterized protein (DUF305 family)